MRRADLPGGDFRRPLGAAPPGSGIIAGPRAHAAPPRRGTSEIPVVPRSPPQTAALGAVLPPEGKSQADFGVSPYLQSARREADFFKML